MSILRLRPGRCTETRAQDFGDVTRCARKDLAAERLSLDQLALVAAAFGVCQCFVQRHQCLAGSVVGLRHDVVD